MTKEWERLLFRQSGIVSYQQAVAHTSRGHVAHELARRRWQRVSRAVLVTTPGRLSMAQQHWIATLCAGEGAVLAGLAAARAGGLRVTSQRDVVDVLVPCGHHHRPRPKLLLMEMPLVRVHRTVNLPRRHMGSPARTTMARSVVDAAQWAPGDEEAQLIVASACQQRLVTPAEVLGEVTAQPRARRRDLVRQTAIHAEGGATALSEIDFTRLCRKHGLPEPERQVRRKDASGRMRYLDAYWSAYGLHVEIDGSHHMDARHWGADMLRQNEVWLKGDRVLRYPAFLLRADPAMVITQIKQAMDA